MSAVRHVFSALLLGLLTATRCESRASAIDYRRLTTNVFGKYVSVMPICSDGPMSLNMSLALYMVVRLDEVDEVLQLSGWFTLSWTDCTLTWNPDNYGNLSVAIFPNITLLWIPDITWFEKIPQVAAFEFHNGNLEGARAMVNSNGLVTANRQILINSYCGMNLLLFPFDTQQCLLTFSSWAYDVNDLLLYSSVQEADLSHYQPTGVWDVISMDYTLGNKTFEDGVFSEMQYVIVLQRAPLFYVFYLLLPAFLMSFLGGFVYILPHETQEKNSLTISILISLSVFMNIMIDLTPPKSDIPLLSVYFFIVFIMASASCGANVVIEMLYNTDGSKAVPDLLKKIFLQYLGKFRFFRACEANELTKGERCLEFKNLSTTAVDTRNLTPLDPCNFTDGTFTSIAATPATSASGDSDTQNCSSVNSEEFNAANSNFCSERSFNQNQWVLVCYALNHLIFIAHFTLCFVAVISFLVYGLLNYNLKTVFAPEGS